METKTAIVSQMAQEKAAEAGELLIRAAAVLGTLSRAEQEALSDVTEGKLTDCLAWAIEGAAMVNPEVIKSIRTHPPVGFASVIVVPRTI
jgi:hypothetical protein